MANTNTANMSSSNPVTPEKREIKIADAKKYSEGTIPRVVTLFNLFNGHHGPTDNAERCG